MIVYFSATGNCEYIAKTIAEKTQDKAISMTDIERELNVAKGEVLGFVVPTYFWGLPNYVENFLAQTKITLSQNSYVYLIVTCGQTTGQADYFFNEYLKRKGYSLSASYSIVTVDNWTVWFDANDKEEIAKALTKEGEQIEQVIALINKKSKEFISQHKKSVFMSKKARYFYDKARRTKHFNVSEKCTGCGLCEANCPEKAIEIKNGKPSFVKDKCSICFRCLHRCPAFAIDYKSKTQKNGQYVHP